MKLVLSGRVVTMDAKRTVLDQGAIYIDGNMIVAVQDRAAPQPPGFADAIALDTAGVLFPGLIELHNHLSYNALTLWAVPRKFGDRGQWQRHPDYVRLVNGPMLKLSQSSEPRVPSAIARFAETKCLLGGVTTSQGISLKSEHLQKYYQGALRVVEDPNDHAFSKATTHIPDLDASEWERFNRVVSRPGCVLLHLSEGFDQPALDAFNALHNPKNDKWAITPALAGIHCAALGDKQFEVMQQHGGSMVWSPLSNLMLYGKTAKIRTARRHGIPVALGSDWSPSGSKNLLHEMKVAKVAGEALDFGLSDADIVSLATIDAASIAKWDKLVGSLEAGKRADIACIAAAGKKLDPYATIISAMESDVALVLIDGRPVVATAAFRQAMRMSGESIRTKAGTRCIDYGEPDPDIAPITFADAVKVLKRALAELPNIPAAPKAALMSPDARHWTLALDEQRDTGFALRPMLPLDGALTGPDTRRLAASEVQNAAIGPVPLDQVCVEDDPDYAGNLNRQLNIPPAIKDGLLHYYPL